MKQFGGGSYPLKQLQQNGLYKMITFNRVHRVINLCLLNGGLFPVLKFFLIMRGQTCTHAHSHSFSHNLLIFCQVCTHTQSLTDCGYASGLQM